MSQAGIAGKVVLVAGASSGIGEVTVRQLAHEGARVCLLARRSYELGKIATDIESEGGHAVAVAGDVTDESVIEEAVARTLDRFGQIDALVNSVGVNVPDRSLSALTVGKWRELIGINLEAAFLLTQILLPVFRRQRSGLFVHISSAAVKRGDSSGVAYQASKAGLVGLAQGTMEEEREHGVRVTVLFPGFTDTTFVLSRPTPPSQATLRKALKPEDVASMCLSVIALPPRAYVPELVVLPSQSI